MDEFKILRTWNSAEALAKELKVKLIVHADNVCLYDRKDLILGNLYSAEAVYAFLCGYEHSCHKGK